MAEELNGARGARFYAIDEDLAARMVASPVFFAASAPLDADGASNCSPRSHPDQLKVVDEHTVAYLDQSDRGDETTAHRHEHGRVVLKFCAPTAESQCAARLGGKGDSPRTSTRPVASR